LNREVPVTGIQFTKYQALGNDYLVLEPDAHPDAPLEALARRLCDRHYGPGADGLLVGSIMTGSGAAQGEYNLRIFNPDGSEAEKSGNGLRIFARFLVDRGLAGAGPFTIRTEGGLVRASVDPDRKAVTVEMGRAIFNSRQIPVAGAEREVLNEVLRLPGQTVHIYALSLGNPHCVVVVPEVSAEMARTTGPQIESHPLFPRRTNVQFMRALDKHTVQLEIWERGAGYTLASGSSACAASAVACRLGLCASPVSVRMPGGTLTVAVTPEFDLTLTGPAEPVYVGRCIP
jgi:diaminopimelate epimerase